MIHVYWEKLYLITRNNYSLRAEPSEGSSVLIHVYSLVVIGPPLSLEASAAHTSWTIVMTAGVQLALVGFYHHRFCGE